MKITKGVGIIIHTKKADNFCDPFIVEVISYNKQFRFPRGELHSLGVTISSFVEKCKGKFIYTVVIRQKILTKAISCHKIIFVKTYLYMNDSEEDQ